MTYLKKIPAVLVHLMKVNWVWCLSSSSKAGKHHESIKK